MERRIHRFDNGISVYDDHLIPEQRERYAKRNVHEAEEEDIFVELIRKLPRQGCFVDVGAAIGYYVLLAHKLAPSVQLHAVEPLDRHRQALIDNLRLNGCEPSDVIVHEEGIAASEGEQHLLNRGFGSRIPRDSSETRPSLSARWKSLLVTLGLRDANRKPPKLLPIRTITLDTLLSRIGRQVDLLQMDVQGLEADVLRSGASSLAAGAVKCFLIGTHGADVHQDCATLLRAAGYTITIDNADTVDQPDGILVATR